MKSRNACACGRQLWDGRPALTMADQKGCENIMTLEQYLAEEKQLAEKRKHQSQLAGIGWKNAIAAQELKLGQHIIYNYGSISLILAVEKKGIKSVIVTTLAEDGNQYSRRYKSATLVAVDELN